MGLFRSRSIETLRSKQDVSGLITALDVEDEEQRKAAQSALVEIGTPAVGALIDALANKSWNICMHSTKALGEIGDSIAVEPLLRCLNERNRVQAIVALGKIGDSRAEPPLFEALHDPDPNARAFAVEALGRMGHIEPCVEALDDLHDFVQRTAIETLMMFSDPKVVDYLAKPLRDADDWMTRYLAAKQLSQLAKEGPASERVREVLSGALADPNQYVREFVEGALGNR